MGWIIFIGIVFLALGLLLFFRPDLYWALTEKWKSCSADEPSDLYRFCTKGAGVLLAVFGAAALVLAFVVK